MTPTDGVLRGIMGTHGLDTNPHVHRWEIRASGMAERPGDNNTRLGYVLATDPHGDRARTYADNAVRSLRLDLNGVGPVRPLSA